jgi:hypothetical protein
MALMRVEIRWRLVETLRSLAHTEEAVAASFDWLATNGDVKQQSRRQALAREARMGATRARQLAAKYAE